MMERRTIWRVLLGTLVSAMGGLAMANSIFPLLLVRLMEEIPLQVLINVRDLGLTLALMWAIGGALVSWLGGMRAGAWVIGFCGFAGGYWLSAIAAQGDAVLIAWGVSIGLLYGVPGGLIMGRVFPKPLSAGQ